MVGGSWLVQTIDLWSSRLATFEAAWHSPSIGPDNILWLTQRLPGKLGPRRLAVYVGDGVTGVPVLDEPEMVRCIENLELGREESLHVAGNGLMVYITPLSTQRIVDVLNRVGPLIDRHDAERSDKLTSASNPNTRFRRLNWLESRVPRKVSSSFSTCRRT
jgi:hypothetical protein